jgi:hypothetical protein
MVVLDRLELADMRDAAERGTAPGNALGQDIDRLQDRFDPSRSALTQSRRWRAAPSCISGYIQAVFRE